MLEVYRARIKVRIHGEYEYGKIFDIKICDQDDVCPFYTEALTYEMLQDHPLKQIIFNTISTKKGIKAYFYTHNPYKPTILFKSWKDRLDAEVEYTCTPVKVSLNELFDYKDIDLVAQYLKERNITICTDRD